MGKSVKYRTMSYEEEVQKGWGEKEKIQHYKKQLDEVGPGFCLAKWTQTTIHLQMGETHSCHHPATHKIPTGELKRNPSALHNTKFKKEKRKEMLEGERPSECDYCWRVEDTSNELSDRIYKSYEPWSREYLEEIKEGDWREDYNPKYVEVAFSNKCNFKCSYCGPSFSSAWVVESKKHGGYPTDDNFNDIKWLEDQGKMPFHHDEYNPYVEAFWDWWPDLYRDLHTFRITGGEPLLSDDTWKVLDYIIDNENPNRELVLGINTNLGVPDKLIDKLIEKIKIIESKGLVRELVLYTSADTSGEQADYIRNGFDWKQWRDNVDKVLSCTKRISVVCMSTFNALSIPRYQDLMYFIYEMKKKHNSADRYWCPSIFLDSSYLRHPAHQAVNVLPKEWAKKVREYAAFGESLRTIKTWDTPEWEPWYAGYTDIEIDKLSRIADWMEADHDEEQIKRSRSNFYRFFKAHDERRGTDFIKTFPEFENFWEECRKLNE
jgi:hypothetical protein